MYCPKCGGVLNRLSERLALPEVLQGVFFDFLWDTQKVWRLPTQPSVATFDELNWLLDLPVWTTVPGEPRFDLAPRTVLEQPECFAFRWRRIMSADLAYPMEMFQNDCGRWTIL